MANSIYETHIMRENHLPFIFHAHSTGEFESKGIGLPNWHENIEILFCTEGSGKVRCDTKFWDFSVGDTVVVNSDTFHTIISDTKVTYNCIIIDKSFLEENGIPVSTLRFNEYVNDPEVFETHKKIFDALKFKKQNEEFWSLALIRSDVLKLMVLLCQKHLDKDYDASEIKSVSCERVKKVMLFIHDNLSKQLTLDEISNHIGISKYHLSREFKDWTGKTIFDSINILKCKEAREMLINGARVSETAAACGFESLSYFSRTFKKYTGILPSDCLKKTEQR